MRIEKKFDSHRTRAGRWPVEVPESGCWGRELAKASQSRALETTTVVMRS